MHFVQETRFVFCVIIKFPLLYLSLVNALLFWVKVYFFYTCKLSKWNRWDESFIQMKKDVIAKRIDRVVLLIVDHGCVFCSEEQEEQKAEGRY